MKKLIHWIIASALIMLAFPWLAVTFIKGDGGMAVCFILFFVLNPIYVICAGVYAGKNKKDYGHCQFSQHYSFWLVHGCFSVWVKRHLFYMRWFIYS